jgi:cyclic-di-GMP phosphodiesterase TipF (flagellum assembly factor)
MSAVKHCVIIVAYGLFAVMTALVLPARLPEVHTELGITVGIALFMLGALLHQYLAKNDRDGAIDDHVDALYRAYEKLAEEIDLLREEARTVRKGLAEITDGVEQRAEEHLQKVVAEVRVLKTLINQLSPSGVEQESRAVSKLRVVGDAQPRTVSRLVRPNQNAHTNRTNANTNQTNANLNQAQILDIVREGLKRDRVDLFLQPVVSLPQRKPRYYECFSRIRAEDGSMVVPEQYIELARQEGLLRAIDNMLLFRCIQLVRKAQRHKHNLGFFCNISTQTLSDRAFFHEFIDFMAQHRDLASQLIFEFAEEDITANWEEVAQDLHSLARLGFYFSMDRVRGVDLDPELLARRRFKYLKLEAATLLQSGASGVLNIRAFKRELDRNAVNLVVEKIESEQQLVELLDHNIDFGQGYLFGEPRLSREH